MAEVVTRYCKHHGDSVHVLRGDNRYRCRSCSVDAVQRRREKVKVMAVEYKGGHCEICGYNKCIAALDFHHRNPQEKDFAIGEKGFTRSWCSIKEELDKCMLLCANCHREVHAGLH